MTEYLVATRTEYQKLETESFGAFCADRGKALAEVLAGRDTLDTLNGVPVFPPITTRYLPVIVSEPDAVLVAVTPAVKGVEGKTPPGGKTPVDFKAAVDAAFLEKRWADLLALKLAEGVIK